MLDLYPTALPNTSPSVMSLFSGCGGLDLGFHGAGFETKVMVEWAAFACQTLRQNFPDAEVIGPPTSSGDVRDFLRADFETETKDVDVLIGGPPCQSFSIAAAQRFLKGDSRFKRTGFDDADRGDLIYEFCRVLAILEPRVFLIENVPGLQTIDGGQTLRDIVKFCEGLGYAVAAPKVIQAADFGVPQLRQRLIIVGSREGFPVLPEPTHSKQGGLFLRPHTTVAQALAYLPNNAANHICRDHLPSSIARYRRLRFGERESLGRVDRLDPNVPSKTVIAGGSNGGGRSHLHPFLARTLTVRECARLQTFPDTFVFAGTMSRQFTQVGNAVPPLLGEVLARAIGQQFFGMEYREPSSTPRHWTTDASDSRQALAAWASQQDPELLYSDFHTVAGSDPAVAEDWTLDPATYSPAASA